MQAMEATELAAHRCPVCDGGTVHRVRRNVWQKLLTGCRARYYCPSCMTVFIVQRDGTVTKKGSK